MKKNYLLPNRFKKLGWGILVAVPVVFVLSLGLFHADLIPHMFSRYMTMLLYMMLFVGVFMVVLSQEKEEDEMIREIRGRSVSLSVFITFTLYIVMSLVVAFVHGFRSLDCSGIYKIQEMVSNIMTPFLIYLVIFRISIWKMRNECREE